MQTETRRIRYFVGREQVDPAGRYLGRPQPASGTTLSVVS
jgi:hypothetical protein